MKTLKVIFVMALIVFFAASVVYAAPKDKENNGQGNGQGVENQGNQGQGNQGQGNQGDNGQGGVNRRNRADFPRSNRSGNKIRTDRAEKGRKQADLRANRPENGNRANGVRADRGKSADHRNMKEGKVHGHDLFNALGKARWSHNPNDERGQGNMGKPNMRDPYGHDKDSGREGDERGRVIPSSAYAPGDVIALGDPMLAYYARTLIEYYEAQGKMGYAAYLREFYNLVGVDLQNFVAPETRFTFKLTVPEGVTAEKIIGVNYTELIDIYALSEQLNDGGYNYWLRGVESTRKAAEENPRLGLTAYATTFELYLSNYLISQYPEIAQQIVEGTYQL